MPYRGDACHRHNHDMTDTPESHTEAETGAPRVVEPPRYRDDRYDLPSRMNQILAWVGIVAGVVFRIFHREKLTRQLPWWIPARDDGAEPNGTVRPDVAGHDGTWRHVARSAAADTNRSDHTSAIGPLRSEETMARFMNRRAALAALGALAAGGVLGVGYVIRNIFELPTPGFRLTNGPGDGGMVGASAADMQKKYRAECGPRPSRTPLILPHS